MVRLPRPLLICACVCAGTGACATAGLGMLRVAPLLVAKTPITVARDHKGPVRVREAGTPTPTPAPTPTPRPTTSPTPTQAPTPTPDPSATRSPSPTPRPAPSNSAAGDAQAVLLDLDETSYDWAQMAPHYRAIVLNAWDYQWIPAIRAANPSVKVVEYKDLTSTRPGACSQSDDGANNSWLPTGVDYCWAMARHPEWFLRNSSGGLLAENGYPGQFEMDYGNPAYQQQWATNVVQDLTAHGWDGVEMDNALTVADAYGVSPSYPTDASVQQAMGSMLALVGPHIKAAGKLEIGNVGYDTEYPGIWSAWLPHLTGLMDEFTWSFDAAVDESLPDWNAFEDEVKTCATAGDLCWFRIGAYQVIPTRLVDFAVASYLLYADGASALGPGDMLWSNYPEIYTNLGAALGTAYVNSAGNWQRDFQGGAVIVNLSTWTGTVT